MPGPLNLNVGTSVVKRENKSIDEVESRLINQGWEKTAEIAGGRVRYYESANFNITAISGPLGTVLVPSGPLRGLAFGDDAVTVNQVSAIGMGATQQEQSPRNAERAGELT